ncbi:MAG: L-rhamnose mutarotase, partial [Eubacteriales bacterium]|nr:L-rhamnose mutarotase [Eubacteriales bacterium]
MNRHAFALSIKPGKFNEFRSGLGQIWNSLTRLMDDLEIKNFSLWNIEELVFGYYEDDIFCPKKTPAMKEEFHKLMETMSGTFEWISGPDQEMRLMYQDFGIVRPNKELIRHRVFATRLKGDFQEEYKSRHDALVDAREGRITPGPDSNFSIWNAGPYIFGYDEIDVTMETEETEESRQATIAWETKMLEIMEWYT